MQQHNSLKLSSLVRCHRHNTRLGATENEVANDDNEYDDDDEEEHLVGIGVGIDLGTTNSAVAMMIPAKDDDEEYRKNDGGGRYVLYNVCCGIVAKIYKLSHFCAPSYMHYLSIFLSVLYIA